MTHWMPNSGDVINSSESEGEFHQFLNDHLETMVEAILTEGDLEALGEPGSDLIISTDDIQPPIFTYGEDGGGGGAGSGSGPGGNSEKLNFRVPFETLMQLVAEKLGLPLLTKESDGRIKQISHEFKTFGPTGVLLDKKRTFKRALKTSIAIGQYQPESGNYNISFRRRDRRYKLPQRVEKPKFRAVVFYMGDISYSTFGERLELEKRLVKFIHYWLDFNYGPKNVEHRFFVHDSEAYEVLPEDFYKVGNAGGTRAVMVFELVSQIAVSEYPVQGTNFYGFYFGDGELFDEDAMNIVDLVETAFVPIFNRLGVVEVQPSRASHLNSKLSQRFTHDGIVRLGQIKQKQDLLEVIRKLFKGGRNEANSNRPILKTS